MDKSYKIRMRTVFNAHDAIEKVLDDGAEAGKRTYETGEMTLSDIVKHLEANVRNLRHCIDTGKPVIRKDITHTLARAAMALYRFDGEEHANGSTAAGTDAAPATGHEVRRGDVQPKSGRRKNARRTEKGIRVHARRRVGNARGTGK